MVISALVPAIRVWGASPVLYFTGDCTTSRTYLWLRELHAFKFLELDSQSESFGIPRKLPIMIDGPPPLLVREGTGQLRGKSLSGARKVPPGGLPLSSGVHREIHQDR